MKEKTTERIDIEKLLEDGKIIQIKPQGYSMYPLLLPGRDEVQIEKTDITKAKRGDVLLYQNDRCQKKRKKLFHRESSICDFQPDMADFTAFSSCNFPNNT